MSSGVLQEPQIPEWTVRTLTFSDMACMIRMACMISILEGISAVPVIATPMIPRGSAQAAVTWQENMAEVMAWEV